MHAEKRKSHKQQFISPLFYHKSYYIPWHSHFYWWDSCLIYFSCQLYLHNLVQILYSYVGLCVRDQQSCKCRGCFCIGRFYVGGDSQEVLWIIEYKGIIKAHLNVAGMATRQIWGGNILRTTWYCTKMQFSWPYPIKAPSKLAVMLRKFIHSSNTLHIHLH